MEPIRLCVVGKVDGSVAKLSFSERFKVVKHYKQPADLLKELNFLDTDVIIADCCIPEPGLFFKQLSQLKSRRSDLSWFVISNSRSEADVVAAFKAGAMGYLLNDSDPQQIEQAIIEVANGGAPMSPAIARIVVQAVAGEEPQAFNAPLSKREQQILPLLSEGYRYKEIGSMLYISTETVRTHVRNLYKKLEVHSRTDALNRTSGKK